MANHIKTSGNATYDFVTLHDCIIVPTIHQKLMHGETKILLTFPLQFHKAIQEGVVWPDYVWVVILLEPASFTLSSMWENIRLL